MRHFLLRRLLMLFFIAFVGYGGLHYIAKSKGINLSLDLVQQAVKLSTETGAVGSSVLGVADSIENMFFHVAIPATFDDKVTFKQPIAAPNLIESLRAGDGIRVTNGVIPIISNTGIIELLAGDGITISGNTITNSGIKSLSAGAGVSVDGNKITNTGITSLSAGTNISVDGNKITNTYSADYTLSGWTDTDGVVTLTTSTDTVNIASNLTTHGIDNQGNGITNVGSITGGTGLTSSGTITLADLSTGIVHSNTYGVLSSSAVDLTNGDVSGTLPVTKGGTGVSSVATGGILYASSTNNLSVLGVGANGQVLTISGGVPAWGASSSGEPCPTCLINNPGSTQTITPSGISATGLTVKQASGGNVDIFKVTDYAGTTAYLRVDSSGNVLLGNGQTTQGVFIIAPTGTHPITISPSTASGTTYTGTVTNSDLTGTRTWTFPDQSGVICTTGGNCSGTSSSLGGSGTANYIGKWQGTYSLTNSNLYDDGTSVGIGTTSPTSKLHVVGTGNITGAMSLGSTLGVTGATTLSSTLGVTGATDLSSTLGVTGATTLSSTLGVTGNTTLSGNLMVNGTGNHYFSAGSVGIGTTAPSGIFHIKTSGGPRLIADGITSGNTDWMTLWMNKSTTPTSSNYILTGSDGSTILNVATGGTLQLATGNTQVVSVTGSSVTINQALQVTGTGSSYFSSGNVGIGTTSPGSNLQVGATNAGGGSSTAAVYGGTTLHSILGIDPLSVKIAGGTYLSVGGSTGWTTLTKLVASTNIQTAGGASVGRSRDPITKLDINGSLAAGAIGTEDAFQIYRDINAAVSYPQIATFALGSYATNGSGNSYGPSTRLDIKLANGVTYTTADTTVMTLQANGNVGIGTTSPAYNLDVAGTINTSQYLYGAGKEALKLSDAYLRINNSNAFTSGIWIANRNLINTSGGFMIGSDSGSNANIRLLPSSIDTTNRVLIDGVANGTVYFNTGGNVGVGTTSPGSALDVKGTLRLSGATSGYVGLAPAAAAGSTTYTLPSADGTSGQLLKTNGSGTLSWVTDQTGSGVSGTSGQTVYFSGTTLTATSNLYNDGTNIGIGTTAPAGKFQVSGGKGGNASVIIDQTNTTGDILTASASGTTKLSVNNVGTLAVNSSQTYTIGTPTGAAATQNDLGPYDNTGTSHTFGVRVYSYKDTSGGRVYSSSYSQGTVSTLDYSQNAQEFFGITFSWNSVTGADGYRILVYSSMDGYTYNYYADVAGTTYEYSTAGFTSGSTVTPTTVTVRSTSATFTDNVGIGTTSFGTNAAAVLAIANSTAPTAGITNGAQLYVTSGELRVMDAAGNATTLSPHNFSLIDSGPSEALAWSYYSERDGAAINVDMTKALRLIEDLSGEQLIYTKDLTASASASISAEIRDVKTGILTKLDELIASLRESITSVIGYFDEIFSKKSHQKDLCIGDFGNETCINKEQMDLLIKLIPTPAASPTPSPTPSATPNNTPSPTDINLESSSEATDSASI